MYGEFCKKKNLVVVCKVTVTVAATLGATATLAARMRG